MSGRRRLPETPKPMHFWPGMDDVKIAGDSWGDAGAPLAVLLHGAGQTRHAWKGVGQKLGASGYYAVAFDARGHGDSEWAGDGNYSQDAMVEDLKCIIGALGRKDAILVGASMGGGTSLVAAGEGHVDARALVIVDTAPRLESEGVQKIGAFMRQKPTGFNSLEEVADAIASYQPHRVRPKNLNGLAKNVRVGPDGKYYWHWDPRFLTGRDLERRQQRLEACAKSVDMPTLLVRGGLSDVLSEEGAQDFLKLCPKSRYVNVTTAGHMVAGDRNDIFGRAVIEFLSQVTRQKDPGPPGAA